jgi:hypothetical protein
MHAIHRLVIAMMLASVVAGVGQPNVFDLGVDMFVISGMAHLFTSGAASGIHQSQF